MEQIRVGIVTYYFGRNYGSVLQAYALQEIIKELGCKVKVIDYHNTNYKLSKRWRAMYYLNVLSTIMIHPSTLKPFLDNKKRNKKNGNYVGEDVFSDFVKKNISLHQFESSIQIKENDYYVCGSDQIWSLALPGLNYATFLRFCKKSQRVSYAPSFGTDTVPNYNKRQLAKYLEGFSRISVREISAQQLVRNLINQEPELVLDPVLLAGTEFWKKRIVKSPYAGYIVCYFLNNSNEATDFLRKALSEDKRKVVWIATGIEPFVSSDDVIRPTPFQYVSIISEAAHVYTDSFHGTAFSVIWHTPFTVFRRSYEENDGQQTRIDSLLEITKLRGRLFDKTFNSEGVQMIPDFTEADIALAKLSIKSKEFLVKSLKRD